MSYLPLPDPSVFYGRIINTDASFTTTSYSFDGRFNWVVGGTNTITNYHLVFDPDHDRLIAIVTNGTGTAYSTDGGASWVAGGNLPFAVTGSCKLVHDPVHHTVSFVAQNSVQGGVYTTDGGVTWTQSASATVSCVWYASAYDPINKRIVSVSFNTTDSIYSSDGGVTWVAGGATPNIMAGLCWDVANSKLVCLPSNAATGSAWSSNGGATWTAGAAVAAAGAGGYYGMAYDPIHNRVVAVVAGIDASIFSTNGGASWSAGGATGSAAYQVRQLLYNIKTGVLQFSDGNSANIVVSADGGVTWAVVATGQNQGPISAQWTT
jgi:hypothetical protein